MNLLLLPTGAAPRLGEVLKCSPNPWESPSLCLPSWPPTLASTGAPSSPCLQPHPILGRQSGQQTFFYHEVVLPHCTSCAWEVPRPLGPAPVCSPPDCQSFCTCRSICTASTSSQLPGLFSVGVTFPRQTPQVPLLALVTRPRPLSAPSGCKTPVVHGGNRVSVWLERSVAGTLSCLGPVPGAPSQPCTTRCSLCHFL